MSWYSLRICLRAALYLRISCSINSGWLIQVTYRFRFLAIFDSGGHGGLLEQMIRLSVPSMSWSSVGCSHEQNKTQTRRQDRSDVKNKSGVFVHVCKNSRTLAQASVPSL